MNILKDFSVHFLFHSQGGIKSNKYVYKQTNISNIKYIYISKQIYQKDEVNATDTVALTVCR